MYRNHLVLCLEHFNTSYQFLVTTILELRDCCDMCASTGPICSLNPPCNLVSGLYQNLFISSI